MRELPTDLIVQKCADRKWQYPEPIEDIDEWLAANTDSFDPRHAHRLYWPDRPYRPDMEILVVDGGANQGPILARTNPDAKVTATVLSEASLAHATYLRHKFRLFNLDVNLLPAEKMPELNRSFDLVIASGSLQHGDCAEAQLGMKALAQVLRPDGVAAFLFSSRYRPDVQPNPDGTLFTAQDCLDLVDGAGMVFQDWLLKSPYYLPATLAPGNELLGAIGRLPEHQMWSLLEPLRNQIGCHLFTACLPERAVNTYRIDFSDPRSREYVPGWRLDAGLDGRYAVRQDWSMPLETIHREIAERIDGFRTVAQIAGDPEREAEAIDLLTDLWHMDFIMFGMAVPSGTTTEFP